MSKYVPPLLVGIAALALAATSFGVPTAPDGNTQTIRSKVWPVKLPRKRLHVATLKVTTKTTSTTAPDGVPVPAVRAIVDFDRDLRLFTRGIPKCDAAKLQNTSTQAALAVCGKAKIGAGSARVLLRVGAQVFPEQAAVTAFNGRPQGGRPVILLHSYGRSPVQVTLVLIGVVRNYFKQGFGPRLDIQIPLIAGGQGALTDFNVAIRKKYRFRGKRHAVINAKCPDRRLKVRGRFFFLDGQSLTDRHVQRCRPTQ